MPPAFAFPFILLCLMAALTPATHVFAAEVAGAPAVQELEKRLPKPAAPQGHDTFELSEESVARLKLRLPALWRKLSQRETTHLLVLAERRLLEVWSGGPQEPGSPAAASFADVFAHELASRFSLAGGVRAPGARGAQAMAPAVTLRVVAEPGQSVVDAAAILKSVAKQAPVDGVILCHGLAEAGAGMAPAEFAAHLKQAADAAQELGADVIAVAPWMPASERPEVSLGQARPLSDMLMETADDEGWMGADLGDWRGWFELPPNDATDEAQRFARLADAWKSFFYVDAEGRHVPRASLHQRLGSVLFQRLIDGPADATLAFANARAIWKEGGGLELACELVNSGKEARQVTLLPLIASGWRPLEARPEVTLEPGVPQKLAISYAPVAGDNAASWAEAEVRLPLLLCTGQKAWCQTLRAPLQPVAVLWEPGVVFNHEGKVASGGQVVNQTGEDVLGTWQIEFAGASQGGDVRLKAGAGMPLEAAFDPPALEDAAQVLPMRLTLRFGGLTITRVQQLTLARNLGLNQPVPLLPSAPDQTGAVRLLVEADPNQLSLVAEVSGRDVMLPAAEGQPAWKLEARLDARSYGTRLEDGSTWPLRAHGAASGKGKGTVEPVKPWAFGAGYAAVFDATQFHAALTPLGADRFQIKLTIPRTYLYLHEWALENGNSQLGVNVSLTLNTESGGQTWSLQPPGRLPNRITDLRVLELARQPTARFSILRR